MCVTSTILLHEKEFFARMAGGDEAAFAEIFYHYNARIYPFIRKMVRNDEVTEEIIQDVFVSLWENRGKLADVDNYAGFIFTMATNKTFNYLKQKAREVRYAEAAAKTDRDVTYNTLEWIDLNQSQALIHTLVNKLPPQKRLIYKLTREDGLSHDEVAQQLNVSKNTVKNHLVETLKFLREHLRAHGTSLTLLTILIKLHS